MIVVWSLNSCLLTTVGVVALIWVFQFEVWPPMHESTYLDMDQFDRETLHIEWCLHYQRLDMQDSSWIQFCHPRSNGSRIAWVIHRRWSCCSWQPKRPGLVAIWESQWGGCWFGAKMEMSFTIVPHNGGINRQGGFSPLFFQLIESYEIQLARLNDLYHCVTQMISYIQATNGSISTKLGINYEHRENQLQVCLTECHARG